MKKDLELLIILIILSLILLIVPLFIYITDTHAQSQLPGKLLIDLKEETAAYTESHDYTSEYATTTMSASVEANPCNTCIRKHGGSLCLDICDNVIYY